MKKERWGSLYILQGSTVAGSAAVNITSSVEDHARLWHACWGHMSEKGMTILSNQGLLGSEGTGNLDFYDHCVFGKQKKVSFSIATHCTNGTLDYIHFDLWGPSRIPCFGGKRYMLTIVDDFSRKVWVYF